MPQVKALSDINHNGVLYTKDQVISELSDKEAQTLIDSEVAVQATEEDIKVAQAKAEAGNSPKKVESQRLDQKDKADKSGSQDKEPAVTLPDSFTHDGSEFSVQRNDAGKVFRYLQDGKPVKKAEYTAAFESSIAE